MADIRNTSKSPDTNIIKQGHTKKAGQFGSDPNYKGHVKPTQDITIPTAKG